MLLFKTVVRRVIVPKINPCNLFSIVYRDFSEITPKEIKIDVPWGHIAGRHWNSDPSKKPILCLHGWKDNCATFDNLLPVIIPSLNEYQFICIDLPGHGFSSHYPLGFSYHLADSLMWVLRIMKHYGWPKITIIGHSFGAIMGFMFATTHKKHVENLIAIDALTPMIFPRVDMLGMIPDITEHLFAMEQKIGKGTPPTYSKDEALNILLRSHMMGMNETAGNALITRGVTEHPEGSGKYKFSHDIRVQYLPIIPISHRQVSYLAKNFQSGLLHIKAAEGVVYSSSYLRANIKKWIAAENKNCVKFIEVQKATHHVHLADPHLVAKHIVDFLTHAKK